ncbi:MAG: hypothetical protein J2P17_01730, partial [Mycobacterium sp.]|nr:hypothetical protein [Mycobacterium sp.]
CPDWVSPEFSPVLLRPGVIPDLTELRLLEDYFGTEMVYPYYYFCAINDEMAVNLVADVKGVSQGLWRCDTDLLVVNIQVGLAPEAAAPAPYDTVVAPITDRTTSAWFVDLLRRCFPGHAPEPDFADRVLELYDRVAAPTLVTALFDGSRAIAANATTIGTDIAVLHWGAVLPEYQGQGLSREIQRLAFAEAMARGVTISSTLTRNERVAHKWTSSVQLTSFIMDVPNGPSKPGPARD